MLKSFAYAAVAAVAVLAAPAMAQSSPVVGTWATKVAVQEMTFEATMTVAQSGGGYTVDIVDAPMPGAPAGPESEMPSTISNVVVDGSKITFDRKLTTPQGEMELAYAATANGNNLTGAVSSSFGEMALTGTRK